jgi:hypothetical protein
MFIEKLLTEPVYFFRYIIILIVSIVIHELAHGFAAIGQGDDTPERLGHITPDPIVHMGPASLIMLCFMGMAWGQMPVNPANFRHRWSDLWVSAAGPLSNFALSTIACLLFVLADTKGLPLLSPDFLWMLAIVNMLLFFSICCRFRRWTDSRCLVRFFPALSPCAKGRSGFSCW